MTLRAAGAVLAGGRSRRMGRDKADILWNGRSLLDHAVELLRGAGCDRVWVSGRSAHPCGLPDREKDAGPGRALLDVLEQARLEGFAGVLAVPVDMPLLTPAHLRPLMEGGANEARAWSTSPLPVWLPVSRAGTARGRIGSVLSLVEAGAFARPPVPCPLEAGMVNVNTPEDLARLLTRQGE